MHSCFENYVSSTKVKQNWDFFRPSEMTSPLGEGGGSLENDGPMTEGRGGVKKVQKTMTSFLNGPLLYLRDDAIIVRPTEFNRVLQRRPERKCEEQTDTARDEAGSCSRKTPLPRLPCRVVLFFTFPLWPSLKYPILFIF